MAAPQLNQSINQSISNQVIVVVVVVVVVVEKGLGGCYGNHLPCYGFMAKQAIEQERNESEGWQVIIGEGF